MGDAALPSDRQVSLFYSSSFLVGVHFSLIFSLFPFPNPPPTLLIVPHLHELLSLFCELVKFWCWISIFAKRFGRARRDRDLFNNDFCAKKDVF